MSITKEQPEVLTVSAEHEYETLQEELNHIYDTLSDVLPKASQKRTSISEKIMDGVQGFAKKISSAFKRGSSIMEKTNSTRNSVAGEKALHGTSHSLKTSLGKSIKDRPLPLTPPQAEKAKTQHIYVDFNEASQAFYETPTPIASQAIYETPTPITPTRNSIVSTMIEQFNNMQQPTESQPIISTAKRQISQNNDKINPINKPQISH